MADMEKVIKGLREMSCMTTWKDIDRIRHKFQPIINDAITMLKEHEAVEPKWFDGTPFCGNCGHRLEKKNRNAEIKCPTCERTVKWG